jgi:hypothetical protein
MRSMRYRVRAIVAIGLAVVGLFSWVGEASSSSPRTSPSRISLAARVAPGRHLGTVNGVYELCVPRPPLFGTRARCRVFAGRETGNGRTLDAVAVTDLAGKTLTTAKLREGRFAIRVKPGRYRVELLFTAKHRRPLAASPILRAWVHAEHTTKLVFRGYAG